MMKSAFGNPLSLRAWLLAATAMFSAAAFVGCGDTSENDGLSLGDDDDDDDNGSAIVLPGDTNGDGVLDSDELRSTYDPNATCKARYDVVDNWGTGFRAELTFSYEGNDVPGWMLDFIFTGDEQVSYAWNASFEQVDDHHVFMRDAGWNGALASGSTVSFGFVGEGLAKAPVSFRLNDVNCELETSGVPPLDAGPAFCFVTYNVADTWLDGFRVETQIVYNGPATTGWDLNFAFTNGETIEYMWNGEFEQTDAVSDAGWNARLPNFNPLPSFGFVAKGEPAFPAGFPAAFTLNGTPCDGTVLGVLPPGVGDDDDDDSTGDDDDSTGDDDDDDDSVGDDDDDAVGDDDDNDAVGDDDDDAAGDDDDDDDDDDLGGIPEDLNDVLVTPTACTVSYVVADRWQSGAGAENAGFRSEVTFTYEGEEPTNGWRLDFIFTNDEEVQHAWNAFFEQRDEHHVYTADVGWNASLGNGQSASFGFVGKGFPRAPVTFTLNGTVCALETAGVPTGDEEPEESACEFSYNIADMWDTGTEKGFRSEASFTWFGPGSEGWQAEFTFANGETALYLWNGEFTQTGAEMSVEDGGWNGELFDGTTRDFGFVGAGEPAPVTGFTVNGIACTPR